MKKTKIKNHFRPLALAIAILWIGGLCRPAFADRIYRNDGRIVEGVLEPGWEDASSNVRIRVGKATITVPRAQIRKILPGGQGDNQMIAAREAFGRRDLDQAILAMADGIKAGAAPESVATMLLVQADAIVKSVDQFKPEARTALSGILTKLDDVRIPRADELIAARVQLHAALGEFDKIDGLLEVLGPKYFEDHPDLAKQLAERLEAQVEQDVLTNDYKNGIDTLRRIERIDPKFASARKTQYVLEWGRRLRDAGKVTDALDLYIEQLVDDAPEIARDRIRVTLEEAEMTMRQRGQLAEAAELYEKYGLGQVPDFAKEHLVRLWRDQGARNVRAGKYDDAREDYRKAESIQAGGGATELLRVDYREKLAAIKDGDQVGHYELGVWCRKNGLSDEALRQFEKALDHPVVGPNAEAYIGRIKVDLADRELKRILGMYEKGQLVDALGAVQQFMIGNPGEGFLAQARELDRMIRDGLRLRQSDQNQQAVGLLEKAQRAYYSGDYDEANRLLQTIFKHYKGTVTYRQARSFYTMVRDRLTLAQLEQGKAPGATKFEDGLTTGGPATAREVDRMMRGLGAWQDADTTKAKDKSSK